MSRRFRRTARSAAGLALAGLALGCTTPNQAQSERPGPREEYERAPIDPTTDAGTEADPDLAAKQAAAQKVLDTVNDRDQEEEKKKLARSHAISEQAGAKLRKGQMTEAVQTAREALKVHEQNVDAMLVLAQVYYKEGKYELVRAVTSSALQVDAKIRTPEETSRAYNLQGFAMLAMGEDSVATQSFKKAAEVDENNAAAWNNLGTRYLDAGDVATATSCFEYALELDPRFVQAHLNYGAALRASRKWEAAEVELRKALELRPNFAEAYFNLGVLYLDADPFPGLETTQRLNKAILNLTKYRDLATTSGSAAAGPSAASTGAGKSAAPRVSQDRADDYIRVAKKGIEKEQRRLERQNERKTSEATEAAAEDETGAEAAAADGDPTAADEPSEKASPGAPTDAGGDDLPPQEPEPTEPESPPEPAKPTVQGPSQPAPSQPAPTQPAPTQPAPTQPAPTQPAPTQPAPTPVQPTPTPPPPQKPSVQRPQSSTAVMGAVPKKISPDPASRGTRFVPSTLNPMEAVAIAPLRVDLRSGPPEHGVTLGSSSTLPRLMVHAVSSFAPVTSSPRENA